MNDLQLDGIPKYNILSLQKMETTFPWNHFQIIQMMYNTYPFFSDQIDPYGNISLDFQRNFYHQNQIPFAIFHKNEELPHESDHHFTPITLKFPQDQASPQNSEDQPTSEQKIRRQKKQITDITQNVPIRKNSQILTSKSNNASLNENRNILPNAIHQILSYVQRKNKSKQIVGKLIEKYASEELQNSEDSKIQDSPILEISSARYYAYQNQLKAKMPNYVKLNTFKYLCTELSVDWNSEVFSVKEQMIYNKVCRTVIIYYLKHEVVCVIMSSKRMQKDKKREHLKVNRKIQAYIKSGFQEYQV